MKKYFNFILCICIALMFSSCRFFNQVAETITPTDYNAAVTAVTLDYETLNINRGESEYVKLTLTPTANQNKCDVSWSYDTDYVSVDADKYGAVITGVKAGSTWIKASCNGIVATCLISILQDGEEISGNQYIYSSTSVVELTPGDSSCVTVSLYGGNTADMELFTWSIDDNSVAEISYARNTCIITALKTGSTTLTAHHEDSLYDYSFVIYVYTDKMTEPYITTTNNILTIDKTSETSKTISVDLINPISSTYKNGFSWNYADEDSKEIINFSANLNSATITPLKNGIAKITVTHENAAYPLDILVRVTTVVKNVYIQLSASTLVMNGSDTSYTVTASIQNYDGYADPEEFEWIFPNEAENLFSTYTSNGNMIQLVGKKNGVIKVTCKHPLSEYSRNVLIILEEQIESAIDSSIYITTSQNYVNTQVGADDTTLTVCLVGGEIGDDNDFVWTVNDETGRVSGTEINLNEDNGICRLTYISGKAYARSAASSGESVTGQLTIEPISEGTLNISISHPKCSKDYTTDITVKVYSEYALLEDPITISTDTSLVKLLNGNTQTVTATLKNASDGEENAITWESANSSAVSVDPSTGSTTVLKACGSSQSQTYVTANYQNAYAPKKILVLCANTEEELESMKGFYSDTSYLRVTADDSKTVTLETFGLSDSDHISWLSSDNSVFTVNADTSSDYYSTATVTGVGKGKATLTASLSGCESVTFEVTVVPIGEAADVIEEPSYLTTSLNAVVLENVNDSATLSVTGINISDDDIANKTTWTIEDTAADDSSKNVFDLSYNGDTATIVANQAGKSVITVKNDKSENEIKINAKCGSLYEWTDGYVVYITTENDVVNIVNGDTTTIGAALVNSDATGGFSWNVTSGEDVVSITGTAGGTCSITGLQAGQAILEISNTNAEQGVTKEVLINVANTEEELNGFMYLSTTQNVVTIGEGSNSTVSVSIENATSNIISGYTWTSNSTSIASVSSSGNTAVIYGLSCGTAKISVTNSNVDSSMSFPLEIVVNVVDPITAAEDPYITCNSIVTCYVGGDNVVLAADLVGGSESDYGNFSWSIVDSTVATLYSTNAETAQIKGISAGITQVRIYHPKASIERYVLIICEEKVTSNYYINVSESIIKMSPTDDSKTITATLYDESGTAVSGGEVYNFNWWADDYTHMNMNYTGASCVIEPISSGSTTIHVSHPKAAIQKDIILQISNYTDFSFASSSTTLTQGTDTFINMEVPATMVDCEINYISSDTEICTVWGNISVCALSPKKAGSCIITAILQTKGGVKQASAQLLVTVEAKDTTAPYIAVTGTTGTIITTNIGATVAISAGLFNTTVDTSSKNLQWEISDSEGTVAEFTAISTGPTVNVKGVNAGRCIITISHPEASADLTLYFVVLGATSPTVNLNYSELSLYIGEDPYSLQATITNGNENDENIVWAVKDENGNELTQDYFTFTYKGNKATIYAQNPGEAYVTCTHPDGNEVKCKIIIKETEKLKFFVYADESVDEDKRTKVYISTFQLYPGEARPIHYEAIPECDVLKNIYTSDSSFFTYSNLGYGASWKDTNTTSSTYGHTFKYADNIGTLIITGTATCGTALLSATGESMQSASITITNDYGNLLTISNSILSATPLEVYENPELLYVTYSVRPACSYLDIYVNKDSGTYDSLTLLNSEAKVVGSEGYHWKIATHESVDTASGIASGTLKFAFLGDKREANCTIKITAINENVITSGTETATAITVGSKNLAIKVYYEKHTFTPKITNNVPYLCNNVSNIGSGLLCNFSSYSSGINSIILGDGEYLTGTVSVNESYSNITITSIEFSSTSESTNQYKLVHAVTGSGKNTATFKLYHTTDYGYFDYKYYGSNGSVNTKTQKQYYNNKIADDDAIERVNTTIQAAPFVGYLVINYTNVATGSKAAYKIPIIVRVRNCPCASSNSTNGWYGIIE